jgi:hypothetical protein
MRQTFANQLVIVIAVLIILLAVIFAIIQA